MERKITKFMPEQMQTLASNPYTDRVDFYRIWYTEEFMKLYLDRYKKGKPAMRYSEAVDTTPIPWVPIASIAFRAA